MTGVFFPGCSASRKLPFMLFQCGPECGRSCPRVRWARCGRPDLRLCFPIGWVGSASDPALILDRTFARVPDCFPGAPVPGEITHQIDLTYHSSAEGFLKPSGPRRSLASKQQMTDSSTMEFSALGRCLHSGAQERSARDCRVSATQQRAWDGDGGLPIRRRKLPSSSSWTRRLSVSTWGDFK